MAVVSRSARLAYERWACSSVKLPAPPVLEFGEKEDGKDGATIAYRRTISRLVGRPWREAVRQRFNDERRRRLRIGGEGHVWQPPKNPPPAESVEWSRDTYFLSHSPDGIPMGTWTIGTGKVVLQPWFNEFRAARTNASSPFGDMEFTPWPDSNHEPCKVQGQGRPSEDVSLSGDDVPMRRPKPRKRVVQEEWFWRFLALYVFACVYRPDGPGYLPRDSGRGNRPGGETDFLAAWMYEREQEGYPRDWLQRATGRKQQSVSQLITNHCKSLFPEPEPWASRRKAKNGRTTRVVWERYDFSVQEPKPKIFHPNHSTDVKPYFLSVPIPEPYYFGGRWRLYGANTFLQDEVFQESDASPEPRITDVHTGRDATPARTSLLAQIQQASEVLTQRTNPQRRPHVQPVIDRDENGVAASSTDR